MREVVLDTETTGLDPLAGHRVVEIGCIELVNLVATGRSLQLYLNPEMPMPAGAQEVHGLTDEFLADKPLFADKADELLEFLGEAQLVIHNAQFDLGFLNAELSRAGKPRIANDYVDTVSLSRRKFPGQRASLDALCDRFGIDNTKRTKHGALVDSLLLAEVYVELLGERQAALGLAMDGNGAFGGELAPSHRGRAAQRLQPLSPRLTPEIEAEHVAFIETLGVKAIWRRYLA